MRLNIDIEKSIEMRRITPNTLVPQFLDYFTYTFYTVVLIICTIGPTIGVEIEINQTKIVVIFLLITLFIIETIAIYKMDNFTVINNSTLKLDRNYFFSLAKENEWAIIRETDNVFVFNANNWFFHERQITIIIKNNLVFINVMSFGKYDIKSPLYARKDKKILAQILGKIKNSAA